MNILFFWAKALIETLGFAFLYLIFRILPMRWASCLGGRISRSVGPLLPVNRTAYHNLSMVFPALSKDEKQKIIKAMWEEWGRVAAEYCHLSAFIKDPSLYTIEGLDVLKTLREDNQPALLFSGHLSHFQMIAIAARTQGLPLTQFYRRANNPLIAEWIASFQRQAAEKLIAKGPSGVKDLLRALKNNEHILMLVDQKFKTGIRIPFLGHPAPTASSIATLSRRSGCPLVPVRVERLEGSRFRITFYPPLPLAQDDEATMRAVNHVLGQWIAARPSQWFWVHKRWGL